MRATPSPAPSPSPSPSPAPPTCKCKEILLLTYDGKDVDGKITATDASAFGKQPLDFKAKAGQDKGEAIIRIGFMIRAIVSAPSAQDVAKCFEGQEVKASNNARRPDGTLTESTCKNLTEDPPVVDSKHKDAKCYKDWKKDEDADPSNNTKVDRCKSNKEPSPGFGDDGYHAPGRFGGNDKEVKDQIMKTHDPLVDTSGKEVENEYLIRWVDWPQISTPIQSNDRAIVTSFRYYHAYVIGSNCSAAEPLCNKCFTIKLQLNLTNTSGRGPKDDLQDTDKQNFAVIKKIDCSFN